MTIERWERLRELFGEALELDPSVRDAFALEQTPSDPEMLQELRQLLSRYENPGNFLEREMPRMPLIESVLTGQALRAGEVINQRFRILRFLGAGGMGEVYEAEDSALATRIAIKTVRANIAGEDKLRERFRQEILLARRVTHPNVCRIFDVGTCEHPGSPPILFLTMELLDGETLDARLSRSGRFTTREALPLIAQMAQALDAAHAAGVVHRDFKAANVMLVPGAGESQRAVVMDFGLARGLIPGDAQSSTTQQTAAIGTPAYMAPEQIEGKPVGPPADIYALGVVVYEMVAGRRPYQDSSPLALAAKKVREPPPSPGQFTPDLDSRWQTAILRCLAIDPADRFARATHLVAALEGSQRASLPFYRHWLKPSFRRRAILASSAFLAATLAIGGWWLFSGRPAQLSGESARRYSQGVDALHAGASWRASQLLEKVTSLEPAYAVAHARLAEAYTDLDMADRAKDELLKASEAAPDRSRLPRTASLEIEAAQATVLHEFVKAAERYNDLFQSEPPDLKPGTLLDLGRAQERANQTTPAIATYQKAAALDPQSAAVHLRLAVLYGRKQDLDHAAPEFAQSEASYRLAGDFEGVTEVLLQKTRIFRNAKKIDESQASAAQALELAKTTGNLPQQSRSQFESALNVLFAGQPDEAARLASDAVEFARKAGLDAQLVSGLNDLGIAYLSHYRLKEAEDTLQQTLELAKRTKSRNTEALASTNLGSLLLRRGDAAQALAFLQPAVQYYRDGSDQAHLNSVLMLLTDAEILQGRYSEARKAIGELSNVAFSDPFQTAQVKERQASLLTFQGDFPRAIQIYADIETTYGNLGRKLHQAYATANRADLLWRLGRKQEADGLLGAAENLGGVALAVRAAQIRGEEALAWRDFPAALRLAGQSTDQSAGSSPLRGAISKRIACLAQVNLGQRTTGLNPCQEALSIYRTLQSADHSRAEAILAAASAAELAGDLTDANSGVHEAEAEAARLGLEEFGVRAAWLAAKLARRSGDRAAMEQSQATAAKHTSSLVAWWGEDAWKKYLSRPDITILRGEK